MDSHESCKEDSRKDYPGYPDGTYWNDRDLGFQRGRRASNKLHDMATSRELGFQRGRRAFNKQGDIYSNDIVLSPNNVKPNSEETIMDVEWDNWFHQFITEASGWSHHKKLVIAKNPKMMAEAVAEMETVRSYENFPRGTLVQQLGGRHRKGSSLLAWDCANRQSMSSDKELSDERWNWGRSSPTLKSECDGTRKIGEYGSSRPCNILSSSPRNIDGRSSQKYMTGYYSSLGRSYIEEHQGQFSKLRNNHQIGNVINSSPDRRLPASKTSKRPESLSPPSLRSAGPPFCYEKQGKQPQGWRRGERRKLH